VSNVSWKAQPVALVGKKKKVRFLTIGPLSVSSEVILALGLVSELQEVTVSVKPVICIEGNRSADTQKPCRKTWFVARNASQLEICPPGCLPNSLPA